MRYNIQKNNSTKTERIMYEVLKEMKVSYKHRWLESGYEIDFLIGNYAIEINGHKQNTDKNVLLAKLGYIPIHIHNSEVSRENIKKLIKQLT